MPELHPVATAYREVRRTGALDLPARLAAEDAYRRLHPLADADTVDKETARIVAEAARLTPEIMWNGVGSYQMGRGVPSTVPAT